MIVPVLHEPFRAPHLWSGPARHPPARLARDEQRPIPLDPAFQHDEGGKVAIAVDGTELERAAWRSVESRDLLLYLLCHPAGRTREQIGRALWPDGSPAYIKNALHVTLDQLRRTLGRPDWIVFEEGRYRVNAEFRTEFDAIQFETDVHAARDKAAFGESADTLPGGFLGERDSSGMASRAQRALAATLREDSIQGSARLDV